ncbi:hypothetical protein EJ08DRAFT_663119 [Tothia fuscella]|uniref:Uncharacterized protein n=1 Tax=Tothia fuscella TaxID=1048955 RepID=A0A9P4TVW0_9PEZI|nr:hypothetical protein EJ08DRAFT_663119 [Tothia fuscella]
MAETNIIPPKEPTTVFHGMPPLPPDIQQGLFYLSIYYSFLKDYLYPPGAAEVLDRLTTPDSAESHMSAKEILASYRWAHSFEQSQPEWHGHILGEFDLAQDMAIQYLVLRTKSLWNMGVKPELEHFLKYDAEVERQRKRRERWAAARDETG